jgi:HlyD family secretion protein
MIRYLKARVGVLGSVALCVIVTLSGCRGDDEPDAFGNFEATEIIVSAETGGQLLWFIPDDGAQLANGDIVGIIDTTQLALERDQLLAQQSASTARTSQISQQIAALEVQHEIAKRRYERTQRLHAAEATTTQQLDQAEGDYRVLVKQIEAAKAQYQTARQDVAALNARVAQIRERLQKSQVVNPRAGTVLVSYVKTGEFVQPGQPLYKIANLDSLILRVYITEVQLSSVRIGQEVQVSIDIGEDSRKVIPGTVIWVSPEAEFTPTPIQTREERAELVYAIKIRVPNTDGVAKIGMPADVQFGQTVSVR